MLLKLVKITFYHQNEITVTEQLGSRLIGGESKYIFNIVRVGYPTVTRNVAAVAH